MSKTKVGLMLCSECIFLNYGRRLNEGQQFALCPAREHLYDPYAAVWEKACRGGERHGEPVLRRA